MKYIVDKRTGLVTGSYLPPLNFSVSGKLVLEVPDTLGVNTSSQDPEDVVAARELAYRSANPSLPSYFSEDFALACTLDATRCNLAQIGSEQKVVIHPGGHVTTALYETDIEAGNVLVVVHGFLLHSDETGATQPPAVAFPTGRYGAPPPRALYGYDPGDEAFVDVSPSDIVVEVLNAGGSVVDTLDNGAVGALAGSPAAGFDFRLRFSNPNLELPIYLSHWMMMYGEGA